MRIRMKNDLKKILFSLIAWSLILSIAFSPSVQVVAEGENKDLFYIEDIKIYQCDDDEENEAKSYFEKNGYVYSKIDLNQGTDTDKSAFLGYKLTKDKTKAITDIRMMAMDTGYQLYDYDSAVNYMKSQKYGTAQTLYKSSVEFADNYKAGSPKAKNAYHGLNLFTVGNTKLGDYIVSGKADTEFFVNVMMKASVGTINAVIGFINAGLTPFENDYDDETDTVKTSNWAQMLPKSSLWEDLENGLTTDEEEALHKQYNDTAKQLFSRLQDFTTMYENANARLKRNNNVLEDKHGIDSTEEAVEKMDELELEDTDAAYIAAFETLNQYAFDDDTMLGDWLISLGRQTSDEVDIKLLYPVIEAMGQNQAELSLSGGILSAVGNLGNNEDADEFEKMVKEIKSAIKEYNGKDSISIWENNDDDDITGKSIALTSDAIRKQSAKNILSKKDKWEIVQEKYEEIQKRIGIAMGALTVIAGVMKIVGTIVVKYTTTYIMTSIGAAIFNTIGGILLQAAVILNACLLWGTLIFIAFTIGWMIGSWIAEQIKGKVKDLKHTDKPDYIFDAPENAKGVMTIRYKSVLNNEDKVADINVSKQYKWCLLAYSKDTRIGSPIVSDGTNPPFVCVTGDSHPKNGFDSVRFFGEINPADANAYCEDNEVSGLYLHYRTESSLAGAAQQKENEGTKTDSDEKSYIGDLIVCTGKNASEAKSRITNHSGKFYIIDQNLTPDQSFATYIGYTITADPEKAVKDIRIAPYAGGDTPSIVFGSIEYTFVEVVGAYVAVGEEKTKPQADALFFTTDKNAGEPILASGLHIVSKYSDAKAGWEPVTLFCGGVPYNFNTSLQDPFNIKADTYFYVGEDDRRSRTDPYDFSKEISMYHYKGLEKPNDNVNWNSVRCLYLYYEPETVYTSGEKYLSGVFFIGGFDYWASKVDDLRNKIASIPNTNVTDFNLAETIRYDDSGDKYNFKLYLCFTYTYNPKRALTDITLYQGCTYSDTLPYNVQKPTSAGAGISYAACNVLAQYMFHPGPSRVITTGNTFYDRKLLFPSSLDRPWWIMENNYTTTLPGNISFGYQKTAPLPIGMYVSGYVAGKDPLKMSDVVLTRKAVTSVDTYDTKTKMNLVNFDLTGEKTIDGGTASGSFHSVYEIKDPDSKKAYNLAYGDYTIFWTTKEVAKFSAGQPVYMYIRNAKNSRLPYISSLTVGSFTRELSKLTGDQARAADYIVDNQAMLAAASGSVNEVIVKNLCAKYGDAWYNKQLVSEELKGWASQEPPENVAAAYIGVTRTDKASNAIRGVILYKLDDNTAPNEITVDSVKYICAGTGSPIIMYGKKHYLYYTTNKGVKPGMPITEISVDDTPLIEGASTNLMYSDEKGALYGEPSQTSFIHLKYEKSDGDFYDRIYVGTGSNKRAALCDLLSQNCVEYVDMDMNSDVVGKSVYIGCRTARYDWDTINKKKTDSAKQTEMVSQEQEAIYDILITKNEPLQENGFVYNGAYYMPCGNRDLTGGTGYSLYLYTSCPYCSKTHPETMPVQDVYSDYITHMAFTRSDRVPYNTTVGDKNDAGKTELKWEYVMYSDNSSSVDLNAGTIPFGKGYVTDNRINMFVQRRDGSVKPSAEITGGFVDATQKVGNLSINK